MFRSKKGRKESKGNWNGRGGARHGRMPRVSSPAALLMAIAWASAWSLLRWLLL